MPIDYSPEYAGANANLTKEVLDLALQAGMMTGSQGAWAAAPLPEEGFDDYVARQAKLSGGVKDPNHLAILRNVFMKHNRLGSRPNTMGGVRPSATPSSPNSTSYEDELRNFARLMMNPNAPELQQARALGINAGQQTAANRGLRGGLSEGGILNAGAKAYYGLHQQRNEAGLRALGAAANHSLGLATEGRLGEGMRFDQNQSNEINRRTAENNLLRLGLETAGQIGSAGLDIAKSGLRSSSGSYNPNDFSGSNLNTPGWKDPLNYPSNPSDWTSFPY